MHATQSDNYHGGILPIFVGSVDGRRSRSVQGAERSDSSSSGRVDQPQYADKAGLVTPTEPPYAELAILTRIRLHNLFRKHLSVARCRYAPEHQHCLSINGKFKLTSQAWTISGPDRPLCDVRCVLIRGSKNTIINTWAFPYSPASEPVFAAELIAFGGLPRLGFLDIQVPGTCPRRVPEIHVHVAKVTKDFSNLRISEQPPEWAISATTGNYLFTRDGQVSLFEPVCAAYLSLLDSYLELLALAADRTDGSTKAQQSLQQLRDYQYHHMEHSPGNVFLSKLFGESWTESFMKQFLFSLPGKCT